MSVREEDKNKNCPSRGLGLAAAAIGVGVGAALYYYFSKRPENPAEEGSTSSGWEEQQHVLHESFSNHESSYTTISEHSTTDTSVHDSSSDSPNLLRSIARRLWNSSSSESSDESNSLNSSTEQLDSSAERLNSSTEHSEYSFEHTQLNASNTERSSIGSDSDTNMEWDVTNSSMDVPSDERSPFMMQFGELTVRLLNPQSSWKSAEVEINKRREQAFRERAWTLEECSICFEGMLKEQEVLALACTHRFHQSCIMPWLEQQQTCPNCRKAS